MTTSPQATRPPKRTRQLVQGALWLLATPTTAVLVACFLLTAGAKLSVFASLEPNARSWPEFPLLLAPDLAVFLGIAAFFAYSELRSPRLRALTWPTTALVLLFVSATFAYMTATGSPLTVEAIDAGLSRFDDAWGIARELIAGVGLELFLALAAAIACVALLGRALRRRGSRPEFARSMIASAALPALLAGLVWALRPEASNLSAAELGRNSLVENLTAWSQPTPASASSPDPGSPSAPIPMDENFAKGTLVRPGEAEALAARHRPNLLVFVLESTRFDHVQNPAKEQARAHTPNLLALAKRGTWVETARANLPHTTKSLFSIFCGRLPSLQFLLLEVSSEIETECLPSVLGRAGYETALFQSAIGGFEERPRLANNLGFRHFESWENIQAPPLGYLASDDLPLAARFDEWLRARPPGPFHATLLTSAPHHSYRLPEAILERVRGEGLDPESLSPEQRYRLLVEREDELVGATLEVLRAHGLLDDTLVVAVGDHGEGFAGEGVRQHDNNFRESGLRVPFIVAGPGVPELAVTTPVALADVAPTLLELLGLESALAIDDPRVGRSIYAARATPRASYFACYYDHHCYGVVEEGIKLIINPRKDRSFYFDLATDPGEQHALPLTPALEARAAELWTMVQTLRSPSKDLAVAQVEIGGGWTCPADAGCTHPKSPENGFFTVPTD